MTDRVDRSPLSRIGALLWPVLGLFGLLLAGLAPASAQEVWSAGQARMSIEIGEGKFIRLDKPAKAVFLSNPDTAEIDLQSARYLYVVGSRIGQTNLFVLGEDDEEIISTTIVVNVDTARLERAANRAISSGKVTVSAVDGAIFLGGTVRNESDVATAEDVVAGLVGERAMIVNRLDMKTLSQVNLQVRIAEVSRSVSEDLGISILYNGGNQGRSFATPPTGIDGAATMGNSRADGTFSNGGSRRLNSVLDALSRKGLVSILAEPNLTARSGEKAAFLAGGQVPYPNVNSNGEVSYSFEAVGVELEFTPVVHGDSQIQLQVKTRVREIDRANSATPDAPGLSERSATTTVELGSGQSFAIAGMFRASSDQSITGVPGLANLPIIGALFRSSRFTKGESELVIIVTPYLVDPVGPGRLQTPIDNIRPVGSGIEQFLTGQMERPRARNAEPAGVAAAADSTSRVRRGGFVLE